MNNGHAKTAGWLAAAAGLALAGAAWAQQAAPVNPEFLQWEREQAEKKAHPQRRGEGEEEGAFGLIPTMFDMGYLTDLNENVVQGVGEEYPERYDMREEGLLTPVKSQGGYGTCWAFAAMGAMESWIKKSEGVTLDLSENHMANLHGWDFGYSDGGLSFMAPAYFLRWDGPVAESDDPYPNPGKSPTGLAPVRHLQRVRWVPGKAGALDNDDIKKAVMKYGPLWVTYHHPETGAGAFFNSSTMSYYYPESARVTHAVALVGWDDNYPKENFKKTPPGDGAYIARNSWGSNWGKGGYFYVSYYDGNFARRTMVSFAGTEPADNYDDIYQYDPLGLVTGYGYNTPCAWGANIFTAREDTKVAAAGFWAMAPRTRYTLYVYTGCTAGNPRSGRLAAQQSGESEYSGYLTVPLESAVPVEAGERFSVVLQLTTPGYGYPLAMEYQSTYTSLATAAPGESFLSREGSAWTDFQNTGFPSPNFCCKAYTKREAAGKTLSEIAISGVNSLAAGTSAKFTCTATYTDGSTRPVEPEWMMLQGGGFASVSADGTVTAAAVDADCTAMVEAAYSEGSVTARDSWILQVTTAAPAVPAGVYASQGTETSCVRVTWQASDGASDYAVYRGTKDNPDNATYLGTTTSKRYSDATAVPGVDYCYFVKAKNDSGTSAFSAGSRGWRALSAPAAVAAGDGTSEDFVAVTWTASEGARCYLVERGDGKPSAPSQTVSRWQEECRFEDTTAVPGKTYTYWVTAAIEAGGMRASERCIPDTGWRAKPAVPASLEIVGPAGLASGAQASYFCRAVYSDGTRKTVTPEWSLEGGTLLSAGAGAMVQAPMLPEASTMTLSATWSGEGALVNGQLLITVSPKVPAPPSGLAVTSATEDGVSLAWEGVANARFYIVWREPGDGARSQAGTTEECAFTDTLGEPGVAYIYRVSAENSAGGSDPAATGVGGRRLVAGGQRVRATWGMRGETVEVSWSGSRGATHYRVWRSDAPSAAEALPAGDWQEELAWNDAAAEPEREYYYWVQAAADAQGAGAGGLGGPATGMRLAPLAAASLEINGPELVPAGGSASYAATVRYTDGSTAPVVPRWGLEGAGPSAAIDESGTLTVGELAADEEVVVTATYTEGATVEASKTVTLKAPEVEARAEITLLEGHSRWPWNGWVDVDYTLETEPEGTLAKVALSGRDLDHGAAMAARTTAGAGSGGAPVAAGTHRISWNVGADYPDFHAKSFTVSMTAAPTTETVPALYMVVDLSGGPGAAEYPVTYLADVPEGGWSDEYKTSKLVLRRVSAGTFPMGSPEDEAGRWASNETRHETTVTEDYWIGVFELTQGQWENVMDGNPSEFAGETRPVERVSYEEIRGTEAGALWPADARPDDNSFMGSLRARTGLAFDLPTEAQWELACRAGTDTALNSGRNLAGTESCANLDELGRYQFNGGSTDRHADAGSYAPNAWGLYDMHGNVWEWCLDGYAADLGALPAVNPAGSIDGAYRVVRGGAWSVMAERCRSGHRSEAVADRKVNYLGFRVALGADGARKTQGIAFEPAGEPVVTDGVELSATAQSGGPVAFAVASGNGVLQDGELSFTGGGDVVVGAFQAGDDEWAPVSAVQTVTPKKLAQTLDFPAIPDQLANARVELSATASAGGEVTFAVTSGNGVIEGNQLSFTGTGLVVVKATQAGDWQWDAVSVARTVRVAKATAEVHFGNLEQVYDGNPKEVTVTTVPEGLNVKILYDWNEALPVEIGEYDVEATVDNPIWQGSAVDVLTIAEPEPVVPALSFKDGDWAVSSARQTLHFTLARSVTDGALLVPIYSTDTYFVRETTVAFADGQSEAEFTLDATLTGSGNTATLTATAAGWEPASFEVKGPQLRISAEKAEFDLNETAGFWLNRDENGVPVDKSKIALSCTPSRAAILPASLEWTEFEEGEYALASFTALSAGALVLKYDGVVFGEWCYGVVLPDFSGYIAYDDASLYANGFNEAAEGEGSDRFQPWQVPFINEIGGRYAGAFVSYGAPDASALTGGRAFALYATGANGAEIQLCRPFVNPLAPGQAFSVVVSPNWRDGSKGMMFIGGWGGPWQERASFYYTHDGYFFQLGYRSESLGWEWSDKAISVTLRRSADGASYDATFSREGETDKTFAGLAFDGDVDGVIFFDWNGGDGDENLFIFNKLAIEQVEAPYVEKYPVTIDSGIAHGTVTADKDEAAPGETVALTAKPASGYQLDTFTVDGVVIEGNTFAMPDAGVLVSATFAAIPSPTFVLLASAEEFEPGAEYLVVATEDGKFGWALSNIEGVPPPEIGGNPYLYGSMTDIDGNSVIADSDNIVWIIREGAAAGQYVLCNKDTGQCLLDFGGSVEPQWVPDTNSMAQWTLTFDGLPEVGIHSVSRPGDLLGGDGGGTFTVLNEEWAGTAVVPWLFKRTDEPVAKYTIAISPRISNGTVTADKSVAGKGELVKLTVTPDAGWQLETLMVNGTTVLGSTFVMPAENVTVIAKFAKKPTLRTFALVEGEGGFEPGAEYVLVSRNTRFCNALAGRAQGTHLAVEDVTIALDNTVVTDSEALVWRIRAGAEEGQYVLFNEFAGLYAAASEGEENARLLADGTDPAAQWTLSFAAMPTAGVYSVSRPGCRLARDSATVDRFFGVYSGSAAVSPMLFKATSIPVAAHSVTVADGIGHGSVTADKTEAVGGETVTLTIVPDLGYKLDSLTVNGKPVSTNVFGMPAADILVSASFAAREGDFYAKISSLGELEEGDYLIGGYTDTRVMTNSLGGVDLDFIQSQWKKVDIEDGVIANSNPGLVWTLAKAGGSWTIHNPGAGYVACVTTNCDAGFEDAASERSQWNITVDAEGLFVLQNVAEPNYYLRFARTTVNFFCYRSSNGALYFSPLAFYKKVASAIPSISVVGETTVQPAEAFQWQYLLEGYDGGFEWRILSAPEGFSIDENGILAGTAPDSGTVEVAVAAFAGGRALARNATTLTVGTRATRVSRSTSASGTPGASAPTENAKQFRGRAPAGERSMR